MNREEHLEWCKKRALQYVEADDVVQAIMSMLSDLDKHPETESHAGKTLGIMLLSSGQLKTKEETRKFIEGFN
jgi:hypothetical protein